eukprot:scaffold4342_cov27-Tisochrysis_lutea.AAC.3
MHQTDPSGSFSVATQMAELAVACASLVAENTRCAVARTSGLSSSASCTIRGSCAKSCEESRAKKRKKPTNADPGGRMAAGENR